MDYIEGQKFAYIEQLLYWRGEVNRSDLREQFTLSESTAAATFRAYNIARPGILFLNRSKRSYTPASGFKPAYYKADIGHCELISLGSGLKIELKTDVLDALSQAIRESMTLEIEYISISTEKSKREIAPLCLIKMVEGFPPALHAWCFLRNEPRTFQIALIQSAIVKRATPSNIQSADLQMGEITLNGIKIEIPKAAIYAIAGQLIAAPELRDDNARKIVSDFAEKLESVWVIREKCLSSSSR